MLFLWCNDNAELCALIWPKYDKDDSGTISAKEMSKMLKVEAALYESVEVYAN